MADSRALTIQSGRIQEIGGADALFVGDGIDVAAAGALTIGAANATSVDVTPPVALIEAAGDPGATANQGKLYTKDNGGITDLFYQASDGTVTQLTPASGGSPAGADTQVQYNDAGSFGANADFTYDGTNVTTANALFADGGLDRSSAGVLTIAATNATSVTIQEDLTVNGFIEVPDNPNGGLDTTTSGFLEIGPTNATSVRIGQGSGTLLVQTINSFAGPLNLGTTSPTSTVRVGRTNQDVIVPGELRVGSTAGGGANGQLTTQGNVIVGGNIDKASAVSLSIGSSTAGSVLLARSGILTRALGNLTVDQTLTSSGPFVHDAGNTFNVLLTDNTANIFRVRQSTADYINISTVNTSERITLGPGSLIAEVAVRIAGGNGGGVLEFDERTGDPGSTANIGKVYGKDVSGTTELFYQDSAGAVTQLTSSGSIPAGAGGSNTEVQFNSSGSLAGNSGFTFDGTELTVPDLAVTGNITDTGDITLDNSGTRIIKTADATASGNGAAVQYSAARGGAASGAPGGVGGGAVLFGSNGGAGDATFAAGAGGGVTVIGGQAGADNGGGGANGGSANIEGGLATGAGTNGSVFIGSGNTEAVEICANGTADLGFFGDGPAAQQTVSTYTDSTGGTGTTTLNASGDFTDVDDNFATIFDYVQEIRDALVNYGLIA